MDWPIHEGFAIPVPEERAQGEENLFFILGL